MKVVSTLLEELRTAKVQQEAKDKTVADGVAALRTEIAALQADNVTLKKELREVNKELKALTTSTNTKTYAGVAAGAREGPESLLSQTQTRTPQIPTIASPGRLQYQERTVVITLGKAAAESAGKSTETLKETAQRELQKEESTKAVQVIAVLAPAQGRLEIVTGSKEQAQAARENKRWVRGFGEGAKPKEAIWFPLKVDGVDRKTLCKEEGTGWDFKDDVLEIINQSNSREGCQVKAMKVYWLSPVSEKTAGSIVVTLDSLATIEQLLASGLVIFGATAGYPSRYNPPIRPDRCYNCNQYGHKQFKCIAMPRCGNCAVSHQTKNCKGTEPDKCAACHGAHKVTDPRCTLYIKERERLIQQQRRTRTPPSQWR
jgi:hypothetical protein